MNIAESDIHGFPLLVIEGDLDHESKQEAREAVDSILGGAYPPRNLLIDLTDCAYLDSGGLGVLFSALRTLPEGGWLGLIGVRSDIKKVLTYAGLLDVERVHFFTSTSDAAASIGREGLMPLPDRGGSARVREASRCLGEMGARPAPLTDDGERFLARVHLGMTSPSS